MTHQTTDRQGGAVATQAAHPGKQGPDPATNPKHATDFDDSNWTLVDARESMAESIYDCVNVCVHDSSMTEDRSHWWGHMHAASDQEHTATATATAL